MKYMKYKKTWKKMIIKFVGTRRMFFLIILNISLVKIHSFDNDLEHI